MIVIIIMALKNLTLVWNKPMMIMCMTATITMTVVINSQKMGTTSKTKNLGQNKQCKLYHQKAKYMCLIIV